MARLFPIHGQVYVRSTPLPDDKSKRGSSDRGKVAVGEAHEVAYFARSMVSQRSKSWN